MSPRMPAVVLALLALAACDDQSMQEQKRYTADSPAALWPDGTSSRPLPEGVVSIDADRQEQALSEPPPVTPDLLARGQSATASIARPAMASPARATGSLCRGDFPLLRPTANRGCVRRTPATSST